IVLNPHGGLRDIESHLQRSLRRLYRVRNLVLHNAATDSLTLAPALRAVAPLLGAGIDRIVRGALLQEIEPLDLAAKARFAIDNANNLAAGDLADLLQLADAGHESLATGERRVTDLVAELHTSQPNVSGHLACLKDCGLVTDRPQGRAVWYRLARPELFDLLRSAEALLDATGVEIALCPNYHQPEEDR
ncbi:MAG TPA: metalloregulator ArsR/SmtB family transcription factor, partial [Acidimicrobiales bacterium]